MTNLVWQSMLDEVFDCRVTRISDRQGRLTVTDTKNSADLLDRDVDLSYGAQFGPDVADVGLWQQLCVDAVDRRDK